MVSGKFLVVQYQQKLQEQEHGFKELFFSFTNLTLSTALK